MRGVFLLHQWNQNHFLSGLYSAFWGLFLLVLTPFVSAAAEDSELVFLPPQGFYRIMDVLPEAAPPPPFLSEPPFVLPLIVEDQHEPKEEMAKKTDEKHEAFDGSPPPFLNSPPVFNSVPFLVKDGAPPDGLMPFDKEATQLLSLNEEGIKTLLLRLAISPALRMEELVDFSKFYAETGFRSLWFETSLPPSVSKSSDNGFKVILGLFLRGWPPPPQRYLSLLPPDEEQATRLTPEEYEIRLSLAAFLYTRDARGGRTNPERLSNYLTPRLDLPQPSAVFSQLIKADSPHLAGVLAQYQPPHAGYRALKQALSRLRCWINHETANSETLQKDDHKNSQNCDFSVFLPHASEGGAQNQLAVAQNRLTLEKQFIVNMERWRWLPQQLGEKHIFVNIPEFQLYLMENGKLRHQTRVVVGKKDTQTPIFSELMQHIILNPSWYVPPSILKKEFLPKLESDPDYAAKRGFEVVRHGKTVTIRQPPGERNALGAIKFIFPNRHSVYMHDTPSRNLFQEATRAFSHGCVRVYKPFELAEHLLPANDEYSASRLRGMVGRGERTIKLEAFLPVHIAYFTIIAREGGEMEQKPDIYGHDLRVMKALKL